MYLALRLFKLTEPWLKIISGIYFDRIGEFKKCISDGVFLQFFGKIESVNLFRVSFVNIESVFSSSSVAMLA